MEPNHHTGLDPIVIDRVTATIAAFTEALKGATASPTPQKLDELKDAADQLMRATGRVLIDLRRMRDSFIFAMLTMAGGAFLSASRFKQLFDCLDHVRLPQGLEENSPEMKRFTSAVRVTGAGPECKKVLMFRGKSERASAEGRKAAAG